MKNVFLSVCALFVLAAAGGCCDKKISSPEQGALLIDVRSPQEFQEGALKGAINLPHDRIGEMIETVAPDRNTPPLSLLPQRQTGGICHENPQVKKIHRRGNFKTPQNCQSALASI